MGNINRTCLSRNTVRWIYLTDIVMKVWVRVLAYIEQLSDNNVSSQGCTRCSVIVTKCTYLFE